MKLVVFFFIILLGCSKQEKKVTLIKQWHLTPQTKTLDIEKASQIPQFENQKEIYQFLIDKKNQNKLQLVIAEGCQGEIGNNFSKIYNGWSLEELKKRSDDDNFAMILAPIPMKLKAKFPQLKVLCGDNDDLVKDNLKAASDMRGFFGFYQKLIELKNQGDLKRFALYEKKLNELHPTLDVDRDPVEFSRKGVINALAEFESQIIKRNQEFEKVILQNIENSPYVIIGGLHVEDLKNRLKSHHVNVEVITPKGYQDDERGLLNKFKKFFANHNKSWKGFMFPEGFQIEKFDFSKELQDGSFITDRERKQLLELLAKNKLDERIINSDFDQDGIRDFTISTQGEILIIAPEDLDWDNDGVPNLEDTNLGVREIANFSDSLPLTNNYLSQVSKSELVSSLKKQMKLIQEKDANHEVLVLEVMNQLLKKANLSAKNIHYLRASKLNLSQGKNNFFNYVSGARTLNYDSEKLFSFVQAQLQKNFKGADYKKFINSYIIPLIIHSMAHEIAHSLSFDIEELSREQGWSFKKVEIKSSYLRKAREVGFKRATVLTENRFRGKTHAQWLTMAEKSKDPLFLSSQNLLSLYSTYSPSEWFAEMYALCVFKKVYPKSAKRSESNRWIQLIGINPSAVSHEVCLSF